MRSFFTLLVALAAAGCAGRAQSARADKAGTDPTIAAESTTSSQRMVGDPDAAGPPGRAAGYRVIYFGLQPTYWVVNCPTDSPSPIREQCSMTRVDFTEIP